MNCPRCGNQANPFQKHGIQIDVCSGCGGVWLDRGELDKLLEMEAVRAAGPLPEYRGEHHGRDEHAHGDRHPGPSWREHEGRHDHGKHHGHDGYREQHGRRRSLLGELFGGFGGDDD